MPGVSHVALGGCSDSTAISTGGDPCGEVLLLGQGLLVFRLAPSLQDLGKGHWTLRVVLGEGAVGDIPFARQH